MFWGRKERVIPWAEIRKDVEVLTSEEPQEDSQERVLCEDESCIGLVGADGRCRVCGRVQSARKEPGEDMPVGPMSEEGAVDSPGDAGSEEAIGEEAEAEQAVEEEVREEEETPADEDFGERTLCSDGSCIGLVGEDGYCRACGLKWKPEGYADDEEWIYREGSD